LLTRRGRHSVESGHAAERLYRIPLRAAQRRIAELETEVKILRTAAAAVEEVVPPKVRFGLVADLRR
jgi:putative transposase